MDPWDTVSPHQGCPGAQPKQSNHLYPYSSTCTAALVPDRPGAQTRHICHRACHVTCLVVAPCWAPGDGLPWRPCWQERRLRIIWLGVPQAVNNGSKWWILFLFSKCTVINFIACPCSEGFYCFPKKRFYCTSQITASCPMLPPGQEREQGLEAHMEQERQWECVFAVLSKCYSLPGLKHLSYASPACLLTRAANWAKLHGDFVRLTNVG